MKIYTLFFVKNNKKYAYRTTNFRRIKRLLRRIKGSWYGYYDATDF